ncbi:MAG TPA: deoxyribodipyrimidine photo-lyase [Rhodocyclaceae bacterium]|nr:deoxyribodipyrimidine photo-lyase [Rhodocyclaceae bacterium]
MSSALVWFRRDLRCFDHAALHHALLHHDRVHCAFIFDSGILDALPSRRDRRVEFIYESVVELDARLDAMARAAGGRGAGVIVRQGAADALIPALASELGVDVVIAGRDYEPYARERDRHVSGRLSVAGVAFECVKDQVIFECDEILTAAGTPFRVFTPYRNAWLRALSPSALEARVTNALAIRLAARSARDVIPSLSALGFEHTDRPELSPPAGMSGGQAMFEDFGGRIDRYKQERDYPALNGISRLSVHLRFGTVSVRKLAAYAWTRGSAGALAWLDELIWRDFYHMILWHHPRVVDTSFRSEYDRVRWDDAPGLFAAWCDGRTGYPLVDAAMRQLNTTGFMHNRLRMLTASFLTKDLGIDWRLGERYFADRLVDYDLAANNGGWQWAASTGCDAQPWFRIFNPVTQSERFDPQGTFIRIHVPELAAVPDRFVHAPWRMAPLEQAAVGLRIGVDYPEPVVDHALARERTLARFAAAKR